MKNRSQVADEAHLTTLALKGIEENNRIINSFTHGSEVAFSERRDPDKSWHF
jgi:hypothetical protein